MANSPISETGLTEVGSNIISCLGPEGTYSHQVANLIKESPGLIIELLNGKPVVEILKSIKYGGTAIVPIWNNNTGEVLGIPDEISRMAFYSDLTLLGWYGLDINHVLAGLKGTKKIDLQTIYSHPQALAQCKNQIDSLDKEYLTQVPTKSTVSQIATLEDNEAVICSEIAAKEKGLHILDNHFRPDENITTFAIMQREGNSDEQRKKLQNLIHNYILTRVQVPECSGYMPNYLENAIEDMGYKNVVSSLIEKKGTEGQEDQTHILMVSENTSTDPEIVNSQGNIINHNNVRKKSFRARIRKSMRERGISKKYLNNIQTF